MRTILALTLISTAVSQPGSVGKQPAALTFFPHPQYPSTAYDQLTNMINATLHAHPGVVGNELCVAHSPEAATDALKVAAESRCGAGVVLLGAAPPLTLLQAAQAPVLCIHGSLDGLVRFSQFAVLRHQTLSRPNKYPVHFASIPGASHHSFVTGAPVKSLAALDLIPEMPHEDALSSTANIIQDFLHANANVAMEQSALVVAKEHAAKLSGPVTAALKLEGSTALGQKACNSDYPTNPSCNYPKWPDHSLPFGPAPAPSPPLPADCICGSPWVMQNAGAMVADFSASKNPSATLFTKDAFQDVSDTHPFHLPHIFNTCKEGSTSCVLNTTTVTMPIVKAGDLFPSNVSAPLSAFELRTKLKSREALWQAAGLGGDSSLDQNMTICKGINERAYAWALENAESSVRARFEQHGEPFAIVDDKVATIGVTGPEWIKDELVYTRVTSGTTSHIEVQSWEFVVGNTNGGNVPWFFPVGMHYCKLLSPARAMEWIYTDSLRQQRSLS